ncbi:hypothetical protein O0555_20835 [Brevibacillus laterosporus]|uniref:hypothetical protein n=1 Tax=Brevibacillus laterosporus TaxID=1465 RepID=UPI00215CC8C8|nr:hypothetical protein [Brevibacillus laterosporus]MCR8939748.1 hypothetical protein [Brevibacillus laterosporus]MCZ0842388.1 hypothetical protein [Brevibacillus laterosporus]MCZ0846385.1 hypothetical protein [Brevibacillus laterosporus]MDN9011112.1 hypothetical protein [Brevibacillus laterosporus]MDO0942135.1 hypothetical protein [Brevibacillus laterosporus]
MEYTLSTGKKIVIRKKKGPHHFIERKLLSVVQGDGGANLGGVILTVLVKAVVGIESVNGEKVEIPENLTGILEFMASFEYEEWEEVERVVLTPEEKAKLEEAAKNLQESPGSEKE